MAAVAIVVVLVTAVAVLKNPAGPTTAAGDARSVTTLDGETVRVPVPGRPTAVFFFFVGSAECVKVMSELSGIANAHPDVYYLAVDVNPGDNPDNVRQFLAAADPKRPAALDPQGRLANALKVRYLGEFIVYDATGTETFRGSITGSDQSQTKFADALTKVSKENRP